MFRERILSQYPKGKDYINLYYTNSDEIAKIITSNLDLIVRTVRILRFASEKYEQLESLLTTHSPVLDQKAQEEIRFILNILKERGSVGLQESITKIEADFDNIKDLSANEILNFLGREQ